MNPTQLLVLAELASQLANYTESARVRTAARVVARSARASAGRLAPTRTGPHLQDGPLTKDAP